MSQNPNYFKIGLFVTVGSLLLVVAIILFGGGKFFQKTETIETYFKQSVQGLSVGAALKFQGVPVGNVSDINFVFNQYDTDLQYVLVRAEIHPDKLYRGSIKDMGSDEERTLAMKQEVSKGLRLQMASQGITGIAFLNAVYLDPALHPVPTIDWKPKYMYIPSAPGTITLITKAIEKLTATIESINFKEISDEVEELIKGLNKGVKEAEIGKVSKDLQKLITSLDNTVNNVDAIIKSKEVKDTITNLKDTSEELKITLKRTNNLINSRKHNLKVTMENLQRITEDIKDFMDTAKKYPAWVLFGDPPPKLQEDK